MAKGIRTSLGLARILVLFQLPRLTLSVIRKDNTYQYQRNFAIWINVPKRRKEGAIGGISKATLTQGSYVYSGQIFGFWSEAKVTLHYFLTS